MIHYLYIMSILQIQNADESFNNCKSYETYKNRKYKAADPAPTKSKFLSCNL